MGRAYKCDWDGKLYDGEPAQQVDAALDQTLKVQVRLKKLVKGAWIDADMGPDAVATIANAVAPFAAARAAAAGEGTTEG